MSQKFYQFGPSQSKFLATPVVLVNYLMVFKKSSLGHEKVVLVLAWPVLVLKK